MITTEIRKGQNRKLIRRKVIKAIRKANCLSDKNYIKYMVLREGWMLHIVSEEEYENFKEYVKDDEYDIELLHTATFMDFSLEKAKTIANIKGEGWHVIKIVKGLLRKAKYIPVHSRYLELNKKRKVIFSVNG